MRSADPWVVSGRFQTARLHLTAAGVNSSWTPTCAQEGQGRGRAVTLLSAAGRFELIATQGGESFGCNGK